MKVGISTNSRSRHRSFRKNLIAALRAEAEETLPPALKDCLRAINRPFFTPIYDFIAPRIISGRVALVGDAASTSAPAYGFWRV